jgi:hypothetical protein
VRDLLAGTASCANQWRPSPRKEGGEAIRWLAGGKAPLRLEAAVTEAEWLSCTDPEPLLRLLAGVPSDRKLRLFAAACVRRPGRGLPPERLPLVEAAGRLADGLCTARDFVLAYRAAVGACTPEAACVGSFAGWAHFCLHGLAQPAPGDRPEDADVLRDLFGPLPFRPVSLDPAWLSWQGGEVARLARSLYDEGRWQDLPVLADALEDAGCTDPDLLGHCRSGGGHAKGCWATDLVLGLRAGAARVTVGDRAMDEVVADCAAAGAAVLLEAVGRLGELLGHPGLAGVARLEVYDYQPWGEEDLRALEARDSLAPLKAIGYPDDGESAERLIGLLAAMPDAGGLELLTLCCDSYIAHDQQGMLEREAEVDRRVGKGVCLVDPSY